MMDDDRSKSIRHLWFSHRNIGRSKKDMVESGIIEK